MDLVPLTMQQDAQCRRLAISYCDLDEAAGFVSTLSRLPDRRRDDQPDQLVQREALLLAFIVSYARPFKRSNNPPGENTAKVLGEEVVSALAPGQLRLHAHLLTMRDQHFAHSDPGPLKLFLRSHADFGLVAEMREPRPPISRGAAEEYLALVKAVRAAVTEQLLKFGVGMVERE